MIEISPQSTDTPALDARELSPTLSHVEVYVQMLPTCSDLAPRVARRNGEECLSGKKRPKSDGGTTKGCKRNAGEDVNNGSTQKRVRMRGARGVLGGKSSSDGDMRGGTSFAGGSAAPARASSATTTTTARTCASAVPSGATSILRAFTSRASGAEASTIRATHRASSALRDRPLVVRFALDYIDTVLHATGLGGNENRAFAAFGRAHRHLDRFARVVQLFKLDKRACFLQRRKHFVSAIAMTVKQDI